MKNEDFAAISATTSSDANTIAYAKEQIWQQRHRGTVCPCCGQSCKIYKRSITRPMAEWLRVLVKIWRDEGGKWIDVHKHPNFIIHTTTARGGDYAKLRYWGLIEHSGEHRDPKKGLGVKWRPTKRGALWADNQASVQRYAHLYLGKPVKYSGSQITISQILKQKAKR